MPRQESKISVSNFSKGLISDFSELSTPPNISINEANCDITRSGTRKRRRGLETEADGELSSDLNSSQIETLWFDNFLWKPVAGIGDLAFTVLQIGSTLYFYDNNATAISASQKSFTVNLDTFKTAAAISTAYSPIAVTTVSGVLFVVSEAIEPFYITYNSTTDSITTTQITIQIRDYIKQESGIAIDVETSPAAATAALKYDLLNQGWYNSSAGFYQDKNRAQVAVAANTPILDEYVLRDGSYPSRNGAWFLGKSLISSTTAPYVLFSYVQRKATLQGNALASLGHFILNAFYKDRSTVSSIPGLAVEIETERPTAISSLDGHVFWGLKNKIYFSPLITDNLSIVGHAYQDGDPTSEENSDVLATDGGFVTIPEVGRILRMFAMKNSIIIMADNGIWSLSGGNNGFKATEYIITRISNQGILSARSVVDVEGVPYWWGATAIYTVQPSQIQLQLFDVVNILEGKLMKGYSSIPVFCRRYAKGAYDPVLKTITWAFRSDIDTISDNNKFKYDRTLSYNLIYDAWFPFTFDKDTAWFSGILVSENILPVSEEVDVVDSSGRLVKSSSRQVIVDAGGSSSVSYNVKYWVFYPDGTNWQYTFGTLSNSDFVDYPDAVEGGIDYTSFLDTFYHLNDDTMTFMQAPYIYVYSRNLEIDEQGTFIPTIPSNLNLVNNTSLMMQVRWDWANSSVSNKFSRQVQVYRHVQPVFISDDTLSIDTGYPIVVTKNKVRGRGRVLQIHFESESGKDFELIGWACWFSKATRF